MIASLNGSSPGGWVRYARLIQEAGADALELNVYFVATDPRDAPREVEERYLELVRAVREVVTIPVAVKVGPYFSSMANMARRLAEAGADGLVLFNRFVQPDIDLETLSVVARGAPLDLGRAAAAAALDRDPARPRRRLARRDDRRPHAPRTC